MNSKGQVVGWSILGVINLIVYIFVVFREKKYTKLEKFLYCAPAIIFILLGLTGYLFKLDKDTLFLIGLFSFVVIPIMLQSLIRK